MADVDIEVTLMDLINEGLIEAGALLESVDTDDDIEATITEDGQILLDDRHFETPDRAARAVGEETRDGWEYWTVAVDDGVLSLAEIRETFISKEPQAPIAARP